MGDILRVVIKDKIQLLKRDLEQYGSMAVALSGGRDSTFLTWLAAEVLNHNITAVTISSPFSIKEELEFAGSFMRSIGVEHEILMLDPLTIREIRLNQPDRCYHCKRYLFHEIHQYARKRGISHIADGSHLSDDEDYRPGTRALQELGIHSPLKTAGFRKEDIDEAIALYGLNIPFRFPNACLASRIPYGMEISKQILGLIERGEELLQQLGFNPVRVRYHREIARIELSEAGIQRIGRDPGLREILLREFKIIGFSYICLDLEGYRRGSLNEVISTQSSQK